MRHSWTGLQYSAWRALLGLALVPWLAGLLDAWTFRLPAMALAVALAIGIRDRLAALLLAALVAAARPEAASAVGILLLHAATHGSPFGAWDARGRSDPGGSWILPRWNLALRRVLVIAVVLRGGPDVPWPVGAAVVLAACDPGWIPPAGAKGPLRVFYDGTCGMCHGLVRALLAEDRTGRSFRFAPLGSATFLDAVPPERRAGLPDSVVVLSAEGELLERSRATRCVLARLGGVWRAGGALLGLVPAPVLDVLYDGVARVRRRLFARPGSACPVVPPHLAERFDT